MADYDVTFARSARRELEKLDPPLVQRIVAAIEDLGAEPRPPGCRKLQGSSSLWRLRVGDYRVVYEIVDRERLVDVIAVRHRRDVYR